MDNKWIVPYNPYLSTKYNCHLNVEICNAVTAVKYLYKYVYKEFKNFIYYYFHISTGHDNALVSIENNRENSNQNEPTQVQNLNEIKKFLYMRYISACESIWRMFHSSLNS